LEKPDTLEMTRGIPVLDPKIHLRGATPKKLARTLFRRVEPLPPSVGKSVTGDEVAVEDVPSDEPSDGIPHLDESS